jgi:hypothetical protein
MTAPFNTGGRSVLALVAGVTMLAIGLYIAARPLWAGPSPVTTSRWLDAAFAFFFIVRGLMNIRSARRRPPPPPPDDL